MTGEQKEGVSNRTLDFRSGLWLESPPERKPVVLDTEQQITRLKGELETMTRSHEILAKKLQRCERALDVLVASGLVTSEAIVLAKRLAA